MACAAGFGLSGTLHFTHTRAYVRIVPPYLPAPRELVLVSGAAELAGALGVLMPATRRAAGLGLVALLGAVFPANVHMALHPEQAGAARIPRALLWARLPLQGAMVAGVLRATR